MMELLLILYVKQGKISVEYVKNLIIKKYPNHPIQNVF